MDKQGNPNHDRPPAQVSVDALVDAHGDALFRYARSRVREQHAAEDLVQDTFVVAIESRDSFRGDSSELTWLIGILRHKVLDHLRKQGREQTVSDGEDTVVAALFDDRGRWRKRPGPGAGAWQIDTDSLIEREEFWQAFEHCVEGLPDRQAKAFTLRQVDENDADEVCKVLGVSSTNLWVILHRARTRLRECLEKTWFQAH